jgi:hypothetical protein
MSSEHQQRAAGVLREIRRAYRIDLVLRLMGSTLLIMLAIGWLLWRFAPPLRYQMQLVDLATGRRPPCVPQGQFWAVWLIEGGMPLAGAHLGVMMSIVTARLLFVYIKRRRLKVKIARLPAEPKVWIGDALQGDPSCSRWLLGNSAASALRLSGELTPVEQDIGRGDEIASEDLE